MDVSWAAAGLVRRALHCVCCATPSSWDCFLTGMFVEADRSGCAGEVVGGYLRLCCIAFCLSLSRRGRLSLSSVGDFSNALLDSLLFASTKMRSPLPDSSSLEAGIFEDVQPSRLSRVHDNVRDLLRRSVFSSVHSSPASSPQGDVLPSPAIQSAPLHAPRQESRSSPAESATATPTDDVPGVLFPAWRHQPDIPPTGEHASIAARRHPDLSPRALSAFLKQKEPRQRQKQHQHAWKRTKSHKPKKTSSNVQWAICAMLSFAIIGLLATCKETLWKQHAI